LLQPLRLHPLRGFTQVGTPYTEGYGASLQSSLTMVLPRALRILISPPVSGFHGYGANLSICLEGFSLGTPGPFWRFPVSGFLKEAFQRAWSGASALSERWDFPFSSSKATPFRSTYFHLLTSHSPIASRAFTALIGWVIRNI